MWMVLSVGVALEKVYQMVEKTHQQQRLLVMELNERWTGSTGRLATWQAAIPSKVFDLEKVMAAVDRELEK